MAIRFLIAALLIGSACGAQAGVVPTAGGQFGASGNLLYSPGAAGTALVGVHNGRRMAVAGYNGSLSVPGHTSESSPGNGATVTTPVASGLSGGAIVELPLTARQDAGDVGQDLPVTLPTAPSAPAAPAAPSAAVPEPSSIALLMAGMLGAAGVARRRRG